MSPSGERQTSVIRRFVQQSPRKVETRVLLHQAAGWKGYAYLWNDEGTEAKLALAGADLSLETEHGTIAYHVPNANQCKGCHIGPDKAMVPIGPKLRNLNRAAQLADLVAAGVIGALPQEVPLVPDYRDESLTDERRARAYLDINCGHCHAPGLPADSSGLFLNWEEQNPLRLGVNKRPVAAGKGSSHLQFDVVPGDPEDSILLFRMSTLDPGAMMPQIGRSTIGAEGAALIRTWIAGLEE